MITGVRLTQLANGEPLLGTSWSYNDLLGIDAVEKRLEDLFYFAKIAGFNTIIDTIKPQLDINGVLTLENNGLYSDQWTIYRRLELYQRFSINNKINVMLEIDFPGIVNESNYIEYGNFFLTLVKSYSWIRSWQIMTTPEILIGNVTPEYKCDPITYSKLIQYIYPIIKQNYPQIEIGGPGVYQALSDYLDEKPDNWLSIAIGDKYGSDIKYNEIGSTGFLNCIDFFSIQGKQNTTPMRYEIFPELIDKLNNMFIRKINTIIKTYSLVQGHQSFKNEDPNILNDSSLNEQAYYELREFLNCFRKGIVPFKHQLIDEFNDSLITNSSDQALLGYGLLYYYAGSNGFKPAYNDYTFLLKNLSEYKSVVPNKDIIELDPDNKDNIEILTLTTEDESKLASIIWPKTFSTLTLTLKAHYARSYIIIGDDQPQSIINPTQITLKNNHFLIVYEQLGMNKINVEELQKMIDKKLSTTETILSSLINLLPSNYNKEVRDINYYKLLRSLSFDLADAQIEIEQLKDNLYLDTVENDALYKNFGVMVNLAKKPEWDTDTYRRLIKGVTQSLLEGPTPKSIVNAIKLFTNFNVNIYELYKVHKQLDPQIIENINPQFAFVIEIEKPIGDSSNKDTIYKDVNYVINIVKPAHTISIVIITLLGTENYREQYKARTGIDFKNSDVMYSSPNEKDKKATRLESNIYESIYGWKAPSYEGQFKTMDANLLANNSITNGGMFLGPRYVLYDESYESILLGDQHELYHELEENLALLLERDSEELYVWNEDKHNFEMDQKITEVKFGTRLNAFTLNNSLLNKYRLGMGMSLHDDLNEIFEPIFFEDMMKGYDVVDFAPQDFLESFHDVIEINNIGHFVDLSERLRAFILEDSYGHTHKKFTTTVQNTSQIVKLPANDLFTIGTSDYDSMTKIYINGKLVEPWTYHEIPISLDTTKCNTIMFYDDVLIVGDLITIIYIKDKSLLLEPFPFKEEYSQIIEVPSENIIWKFYEPMNRFRLNITPLGTGILWADHMTERHNMQMYTVDGLGNVTVIKNAVYI
jgi:hypothetical protein